jgi:glycosyltransferase involved in cell wall biosynthesis
MKLLLVAQRYGRDIAGGAEQLLRQFAERLDARGHRIKVLTSCAASYADWANAFPAGPDEVHGIPVYRLPTRSPRDNRLFAGLDQRVRERDAHSPLSAVVADCWSSMVGPELPDLGRWLDQEAPKFDAVVFSGYMFRTTVEGIPVAASHVPTVVQPVVHDEPYVRLATTRAAFDHAAGVCALTQEEADLIRRRFRPSGVLEVVGGGLGPVPDRFDDALDRFGLTSGRYIVSVGRLEPGKGVTELIEYFGEFRRRHDSDVQLVLVGSNTGALRAADGVVFTGFVDDVTRWTLTAGAQVLIQPSYFESFSLSLAEGWQVGRPALVQGRCAVLDGQVRRSGGGLSYHTYAEFDAALQLLLADPDLRTHLGAAGSRYVQRYEWSTVLDSFERCVQKSIEHWHIDRAKQGVLGRGGVDEGTIE